MPTIWHTCGSNEISRQLVSESKWTVRILLSPIRGPLASSDNGRPDTTLPPLSSATPRRAAGPAPPRTWPSEDPLPRGSPSASFSHLRSLALPPRLLPFAASPADKRGRRRDGGRDSFVPSRPLWWRKGSSNSPSPIKSPSLSRRFSGSKGGAAPLLHCNFRHSPSSILLLWYLQIKFKPISLSIVSGCRVCRGNPREYWRLAGSCESLVLVFFYLQVYNNRLMTYAK